MVELVEEAAGSTLGLGGSERIYEMGHGKTELVQKAFNLENNTVHTVNISTIKIRFTEAKLCRPVALSS